MRKRIKTEGIKIPVPGQPGINSIKEESNQKNKKVIPVDKDDWQNFWKYINEFNKSIKPK